MELRHTVQGLRLDSDTVRFLNNKIDTGLDRFRGEIRRVHLHVVDQNGPKGGRAISAMVKVYLKRGGLLVRSVTDDRVYRCISRAVELVEASIRDLIVTKRSRHLRRCRHAVAT